MLVMMIAMLTACATHDTPDARPARTPSVSASPTGAIDVGDIEASLERQIDRKLGVEETVVKCQAPMSWEVGEAFQCNVDSAGFPPGIANVTKERDDGRYSWYITNTCEDQARIVPTPLEGCVTPSSG